MLDKGSGILPLQSSTSSDFLCFLISLLWILQPVPPPLSLDSGRSDWQHPVSSSAFFLLKILLLTFPLQSFWEL